MVDDEVVGSCMVDDKVVGSGMVVDNVVGTVMVVVEEVVNPGMMDNEALDKRRHMKKANSRGKHGASRDILAGLTQLFMFFFLSDAVWQFIIATW